MLLQFQFELENHFDLLLMEGKNEMLILREINISFSLYTIINREIANCALTNPLFLNNFIKSLVFKLLSQIVIITRIYQNNYNI